MNKQIVYDRITRDYAMYTRADADAAWELVGYRSTYSQAETALNEIVFELLMHAHA